MAAAGWELRPLQSPPALTRGHEINRFHKFFAHQLFAGARWSIYIDGNVTFGGLFAQLIAEVSQAKAGIGTFIHPNAHSLRKEAEVCGLGKFDGWDFAKVEAQLAQSARAGVDLDAIIPACYILVRDHEAPQLASAMSLWWSQIFEYTKRDQMSFPYILNQSGLQLQFLDADGGIDSALVIRRNHTRPPFLQRAIRRAKSFVNKGR
ncbi:MAG: glycosyltransferase domain-containing protein [Pseudomonadota bacterium]